jgi:hypothetical protein
MAGANEHGNEASASIKCVELDWPRAIGFSRKTLIYGFTVELPK